MKRFWTAEAATGFAFGWLAGCNDYNNSIQAPTGATLTNLSPSGAVAGASDFQLTVNAAQFNGFNAKTVIQWNGAKLPTNVVDTTTATTTIPASLVSKIGSANVNTFTPQTGAGQNGLSNTLAFTVNRKSDAPAGAPLGDKFVSVAPVLYWIELL